MTETSDYLSLKQQMNTETRIPWDSIQISYDSWYDFIIFDPPPLQMLLPCGITSHKCSAKTGFTFRQQVHGRRRSCPCVSQSATP